MFYMVWGVRMLQLDLKITMALASCGANELYVQVSPLLIMGIVSRSAAHVSSREVLSFLEERYGDTV